MAKVDFSDLKSSEAWFAKQSVEVRCAMTSRAALRVFANFRANLAGKPDDLDMGLLRAMLTSAGRGSGRPTDVDWDTAATNSATNSATSALSATNSALSATNSAIYSAADSATDWDSKHLDTFFGVQLWPEANVPQAIAKNHNTALNALRANPAWAFWLRFYEGMWEGTFTEWDLAFEVIKIAEEDWEKGYEHVGDVIAGIEADLLTKKTHIAETVFFQAAVTPLDDANPLDGQFDVVAIPVEQSDSLARAVSKVEDSFEDALTLGHGQHVRQTSLEGLILSRVFAKYRSDPHRVEMDFEDVRRVLVANICTPQDQTRNYPDCDELQILIAALLSACDDIRGAYPEIAQARDELDAQDDIGPLPPEVKNQIALARPMLIAISQNRMRDGMEEDIPELINDAIGLLPKGAPELPSAGERVREPRKSVLRRFTNRLAEMRIQLGQMAKEAIASPEGQFVGLITLIGSLISMLGGFF